MRYQKQWRCLVAWWLVATVVSGCDLSSSTIGEDRVATDDMDATIRVEARDATVTEVWAQLRDMNISSDNVYVTLGQDSFRASTVGDFSTLDFSEDLFGNVGDLSHDIKRLHAEGDIDPEKYSARFPGDYVGRTFTVSFTRKGKRTSAPLSTVVMPEGFTLDGPATDQMFSLANDDIVVTWSPVTTNSADAMFLNVSASCANGRSYEHDFEASGDPLVVDPGTRTITTGELNLAFAGIIPNCNVTIMVVRSRLGILDPAYGQGSITARQERQVRVLLVP